MAQLTVRNLDRNVIDALKERAAAHGRSAEAEHRLILRQALLPDLPAVDPEKRVAAVAALRGLRGTLRSRGQTPLPVDLQRADGVEERRAVESFQRAAAGLRARIGRLQDGAERSEDLVRTMRDEA